MSRFIDDTSRPPRAHHPRTGLPRYSQSPTHQPRHRTLRRPPRSLGPPPRRSFRPAASTSTLSTDGGRSIPAGTLCRYHMSTIIDSGSTPLGSHPEHAEAEGEGVDLDVREEK